jgi:hypothetical protein
MIVIRFGRERYRRFLPRIHANTRASKRGDPITQAGRTVDEDFPGGGYIFSPTGERV